ncbi:peptidyl-prolyl cis-trans isomerase [Lutimonas sp.]|uniref:peptidylprolyl isomerase n=1 Tax=Lutimonas sp. TaxID=1872403 RepID=UPI003D9B2876
MKKILKEPLVHFLLIGLSLFILYGLVNKDTDDAETIIIDDYDMKNIIASWEMQWKRLPTDEELKSLILQNIRQEIFYQEALKINLDHNDEIIKRRLSQKMQFLASDIASLNEPTDEDLKAYYQENLENYKSPYTYSLYQIIFSPDYRNNPKTDAENTLTQIAGVSPEKVKSLGDNMPFPYQYSKVEESDLSRELGMNFSESLRSIDSLSWTGPIKSGYGYHLVYIVEKEAPLPIAFEFIKKEVLRDYEYEKQRLLEEEIFNEYRKNYQIQYELDPDQFDQSFIDYLNDGEI